MTGNERISTKLTTKQERAIVALLTEATIVAAAAQAKVSEPTLRRWLRLPDFQKEYRQARRDAVETALARLQQATDSAVEALVRNLTCGHPGSEIRAGLGILDQSVRGVELLDLEERIAALEERGTKHEQP